MLVGSIQLIEDLNRFFPPKKTKPERILPFCLTAFKLLTSLTLDYDDAAGSVSSLVLWLSLVHLC